MGIRALSTATLLATALGCLGCAAPASTAEPPRRPAVIVASGEGRVTATPDTAVVQLGAEARASAVADATAEMDRRMRAVLGRLRAVGVAEGDIKTVVASIDPLPAPPRGGEQDTTRIASYRVVNVVEVRVRDLGALGRLLDGAVAAGANVVRGVRFTLENRGAVEAEARARAVRDATTKAHQLAEAAGVRLGELVLLTEGSSPRPLMERFGPTTLTARSIGPVETGQLETIVTVEAHFRIAGP